MNHWPTSQDCACHEESLFDDRRVRCFEQRPQSIYALWLNAWRRYPQKAALVYGERTWTFAQVHTQVQAVANGLRRAGVAAGDRVALYMENRPEYVWSLFGIQLLGAIAVPIGPREQLAGVSYSVNQCTAKAIIFDAAWPEKIPSLSQAPSLTVRLPVGAGGADSLEALIAWGLQAPNQDAASVDEQDTAIILYTSGTTGSPKGAMLTHVNVAHSVRHLQEGLGLTSADRVAVTLPMSHVSGLITILLSAMHVGATCVIAPAFKADGFLAFMEAEAITYTLLVPAMYALCLLSPQIRQRNLSRWRIGLYGGAPMSESTIQQLAQALPSLGLINAYGATETAAPTSISPRPSDIAHARSIGVALHCVQIKVVDEQGQELGCGADGELWIGGPMIIPGYWNNPQANSESFTDGFWHSGDIGHVDQDGFIYLVDRKKDMLSRGGFKIYSQEVENRLMAYPGVLEAAIVGKPCEVLGERVHAFVYAPNLPCNTAALRQHCAEVLTDYKVPESITWSSQALPRNANGKILKRNLRDLLLT